MTTTQVTTTQVMARLVCDGADAAIDFYQRALGAEPVTRHTDDDGHVVHAEVRIGQSRIALKDADDVDVAPATLGGSPVLLNVHVPDTDATAAALLTAGARVVFEPADHGYGYYDGRFADPFGYQWIVSQDLDRHPR